MMTLAATLGYPRFGAKRELKRALESYWAGKSSAADLIDAGRRLRLAHWQLQRDAGIDVIPSNDFSFYDHVLDMAVMVGAIPERYAALDESDLDRYFAMARGIQRDGFDVPAMEMTKWFDTNYHYIVPELHADTHFHVGSTKAVDDYLEAKAAGIETRPVLLGPVTFLLLSKTHSADVSPLDFLPSLLPVYVDLLGRLAAAGAAWVQIDEPCLALDLTDAARDAYRTAYAALAQVGGLRLMLTTYFERLGDNLPLACSLPVAGLHVDLVRAHGQLDDVLAQLPPDKALSLGLVDGRNLWRADLDAALAQAQRAIDARGGDKLHIASSCSLLFSPHDLTLETDLDAELASWLSFARQKLDEIVLLAQAANGNITAAAFSDSRAAALSRRQSSRTRSPQVRARINAIDAAMLRRQSAYPFRRDEQAVNIPLPLLPTTTIGSFPQTEEVRAQRAAFQSGKLTRAGYDAFLRAEIERTIRLQEDIGLDVLVHGEFERTDMVEYFGEQLEGFAFTRHGWVQSYGSRGVRPPIIYGDVSRPAPMTVTWSAYAQSLTDAPVKGMLTGPVTILQWSFVRDDQPRADTCRQIALAIRDEVVDLEHADIQMIQIDEPALREGLPLRHSDWGDYLRWAVECFRLASSGVEDTTQIHTHMCYAEFGDIIDAIAAMDADVISIEASRSQMELTGAFQTTKYPNAIGPGVYDIHSPRVPSEEEIEALIERAAATFDVGQLWINPDCGLKTRRWEEVIPALRHMVEAGRKAREKLGQPAPSSD